MIVTLLPAYNRGRILAVSLIFSFVASDEVTLLNLVVCAARESVNLCSLVYPATSAAVSEIFSLPAIDSLIATFAVSTR